MWLYLCVKCLYLFILYLCTDRHVNRSDIDAMRKGDHYIRMLDAQLVICDETQLFLHDRDPGDNLLVGWAYEVGILVDARKVDLICAAGINHNGYEMFDPLRQDVLKQIPRWFTSLSSIVTISTPSGLRSRFAN